MQPRRKSAGQRPRRDGVITIVSDDNHQRRRELQHQLGKGFKVVYRPDGPEQPDIMNAPCSDCGHPMGLHLQPEYKCPSYVVTDAS
jgi:hypothetical protein